MKILPYKLATTNDKLTSRAGLLAIAQLMESLKLSERVDQLFPQPMSNRGFKPSVFVQTLLLMLHDGGFHFDDVRQLKDDDALRMVLGLETIPQACSLGAWLRRMSHDKTVVKSMMELNKVILHAALHHRKGITLDIDATGVVSGKKGTLYGYTGERGYFPMVGHAAETGQVIACDFREGNVSPNRGNLEFIKQCQNALPDGCYVQSLRIDAAGYQSKIIQYCDEHSIRYAIRAKTSAAIRSYIHSVSEGDWHSLLDKNGKEITNQDTCRTTHCVGDYEKPFTLIIQRSRKKGQGQLDLNDELNDNEIVCGEYIYRAIACNLEDMTDSEIIHWYNQRAEDSENRIKELKTDFGGDTLPCTDFNANALYFSFCALAYNVFALMRQLLPLKFARHRASTIRWRLYAIAAKVVKTGRQYFVKLQLKNQKLLEEVMIAIRRFEPPPI